MQGPYNERIRTLLMDHIVVLRAVIDQHLSVLSKIVGVMVDAYRDGKKLVLFGNGGSAADAQHIAAEMVGSFANRGRPALPALALTVNTSVLTAIANDFGYEEVFRRQVEAVVKRGDVVIGLSTSGNSENVLRGLEQAQKKGATTVAFTGEGGGKLKGFANLLFAVPSQNTARIQEAHLAALHIICGLVEESLFVRK